MSGDLELNKFLGAGLATALVILGLREVTSSLFESKPPAKPGYAIAVAAPAEGGGAAAPAPLPDWGTVLKTADVAAGQTTFAKCQSCHVIAQGAAPTIGPNLYGAVGRAVASYPGYAYSDAMKAHAKETPNWTYDALFTYLDSPQGVVPGTKMTFMGVKPGPDRINLIAYLRSQGSSGYPIPAPDPKRQPGAAAAAPAPAGASAPASAPGAASAPAASAPASAASAPAAAAAPAAKPAEEKK
jgi:cytochrome c